MINCWFKKIEFHNFDDLTEKLNEISSEAGVHDVCVLETQCQIDEKIHSSALVKVTGIKPLGSTIDGSGKCKVTT